LHDGLSKQAEKRVKESEMAMLYPCSRGCKRRVFLLGLLKTSLASLGAGLLGSFYSPGDLQGEITVTQAHAQACIDRLMSWYNPGTGLWNTTGWWNSANSLEATINYARLTNDHQYDSLIENTFNQARSYSEPGGVPFSANYYDDQLWWCLALIAAYDLLKDNKFLNAAIAIFHDCGYAVDTVCGGGLWWDRQHIQKGSAENLLYIIAACRLYYRTKVQSYHDIAVQTWAWFETSGLLDKEKLLVYDQVQANCGNMGMTTWTYNAGLAIGALVELSQIVKLRCPSCSFGYIVIARGVLQASLARFTSSVPNGILVEPCEATNTCSWDGPQFKGVFMRYVGQAAPHLDLDGLIHPFVRQQVTSLWGNARSLSGDNAFGLHWAGPYDSADAARQTSALDAFNAALLLGL
jgi:predicted alpha-1,6-mannanase (GH76 family)